MRNPLFCGNISAMTDLNAKTADWHPADIGASLKKRGWSLRRLSVFHGYSPTVLENAIRRPWPKGERLIAEAIGVAPETIWPERHATRAALAASGKPRRGRPPHRSSATDTSRLDAHGNPAKSEF